MAAGLDATTSDAVPGLVIDRAAWRDLRAVARVQRSSFRPGLAYGLGALALLRALPGVVFLVARLPGLPVAGCVIGDRYRGNLRIINLAVAPDARRQGVGSALLRASEAAVPMGDVVLIAEEGNTGAQALYLREGYVRSGFARNYYGSGRHGVWMKKTRAGEAGQTIRV
jgi:ribosomal-protein-alanine N-acetyltransferase